MFTKIKNIYFPFRDRAKKSLYFRPLKFAFLDLIQLIAVEITFKNSTEPNKIL